MNILLKNIVVAASLSVLLAAGGCDSSETPPSADPVEISLFTKAPSESSGASFSHRLLVFDNNSSCQKNITFVPGSSSVSLTAGTYRFAALSVPEGLNLAAANTTQGVTGDMSVGFGTNLVQEFRISAPAEVTVGETPTTYTATLAPVTAVLSLNLSNLPAGKEVAFSLSKMYTSVKLDGKTYSGSDSYLLKLNAETVCFPTEGAVELAYTVGGGDPQTLYIGSPLTAGSRLSVHLTWSENARVFLLMSTTVTDWALGNNGGEDGSAEMGN